MSVAPGKESDARPLTAGEIQELPPWAMPALAARCAMRVQPLVGTESFRDRTLEEMVSVLEIPVIRVRRELEYAKAWLLRYIRRSGS